MVAKILENSGKFFGTRNGKTGQIRGWEVGVEQRRGTGRDASERGEVIPPPPSKAPSLCPATVSLTASASFNGICNRQ